MVREGRRAALSYGRMECLTVLDERTIRHGGTWQGPGTALQSLRRAVRGNHFTHRETLTADGPQ